MEKMILSSLLFNEDYTRKVLPYLKKDYFHQMGDQVVYKLIRDHYVKYNKLPSAATLQVDLDNSSLKENAYDQAATAIQELSNPHAEFDWLVDNTELFCQKQAFYNALSKASGLIEGDTVDDYGQALGLVQDALAVTFNNHIGHDYFEDAEARFLAYHEKKDHLPCDLQIFNKVTKGGFREKSLTLFLAPTGVGKSLALCHMASSFLSMGKNVLYITLEMSEKQVAERIDANLLDIPFEQLDKIERGGFIARVNRLRKKTTGQLIIHEYPAHQAHSGHFRHLINELRIKKDFVPDVIVIDYLGICGSSTTSRNDNMFEKGKRIAEEIRALAQEFKCRAFSAVQVNREGTKAGDFSLTDIAESWGIANTADYAYGIVATEELLKLKKWKILRLKDRYNNYTTYYPSFIIGIDHDKMRMYDIDSDNDDGDNDNPVFDSTSIGDQRFMGLIS